MHYTHNFFSQNHKSNLNRTNLLGTQIIHLPHNINSALLVIEKINVDSQMKPNCSTKAGLYSSHVKRFETAVMLFNTGKLVIY